MGCSNGKHKTNTGQNSDADSAKKTQESNINNDGKIEEVKEQSQKQNILLNNKQKDESIPTTGVDRKRNQEQQTQSEIQNENGNDIVTSVHENSHPINTDGDVDNITKTLVFKNDINQDSKMEINQRGSSRNFDTHKYFTDDLELREIANFEDDRIKIDRVQGYAEKLKIAIENFQEEKYSLQFCVLNEKLMRCIEELKKIKSDHNDITKKKNLLLENLKEMHAILNRRVIIT